MRGIGLLRSANKYYNLKMDNLKLKNGVNNMKVNGVIISGEFDHTLNEFSLQKVKHFYTESTLRQSQVNLLYDYLEKHHQEEGGQFITLYDQLPVKLSQNEMNQLLNDLKKVKELYH